MELRFVLNEAEVTTTATPDEPLLEVLGRAGVRGCRLTCGIGICGACTAEVDGAVIATCIYPAALAQGRTIRTIESLDENDAVAAAFVEQVAAQCGYCIPGMVLTAKNLVEDQRCSPADVHEGMAGNLCRCGCYLKIQRAVDQALTDVRGDASASGRS